ncbi:AraC family transcriptional regulator [Actinoplanes sp. NPDC049681]|uniref:AraC family transcriptional regulator n=1 Tax=Actinoplanes sp. NPDC049681 TaxID=3363905 RepID=UPI0037A2C776
MFCSSDIDSVRDFYADHFGIRASIDASQGPAEIDFVAHWLQHGPLQLLEHSRVPSIVLESQMQSYGLGFAISGTLTLEQGRTHVTTGPARALVHRPDAGRFTARVGEPSRVRLLAIESTALEVQLERLLEHPVRGPITFAPTLDLSLAGTGWLGILRMFTDGMHDPDSLIHRSPVAGPLTEALLAGLLMISDHPYREALDRPAARCHPRSVRHALDAIHSRPDHPHTPGSLAQLSGVGVRTLQDGFRRHVGASPVSYLRHVRLSRVHDDLRRGAVHTVAEAASRWGFTHLGRFAAAYQRRYGTSPSTTLRRGRTRD